MRRTRTPVGEIELDLGRYELRRRGRRVKLERKPMELLIFLVSRREQLVSHQDIVAKLWRSNLFVLRRALKGKIVPQFNGRNPIAYVGCDSC
ncbi:MAG TPA: winged helix-turn-helix domain-containing protein [Terriglobia bacterium]|nr:winged helix-turn-helix domain-containing protein [Terriglobia bacterium]